MLMPFKCPNKPMPPLIQKNSGWCLGSSLSGSCSTTQNWFRTASLTLWPPPLHVRKFAGVRSLGNCWRSFCSLATLWTPGLAMLSLLALIFHTCPSSATPRTAITSPRSSTSLSKLWRRIILNCSISTMSWCIWKNQRECPLKMYKSH